MSAGAPCEIARRVYYADTDAGGVAHHSAYVRWCEQARTEWMRANGLRPAAWAERGLAFVIASLHLDYLAPLKLDDEFHVCAWLRQARPASAVFGHRLTRAGAPVCRGCVRVACVSMDDHSLQAVPERLFALAGS